MGVVLRDGQRERPAYRQLLGQIWAIPPHGGTPDAHLLLAAAFGFLFTMGVTVVKSTAAALFLARVGSAPLPYVYMGSALVVTVVSLVLARPLAARPPLAVLRAAAIISGVGLLLLAASSVTKTPAVLGALYVLSEAYATTMSVLFWAVLGEALDIRHQRKIFGWFSGIGMAGVLAGGLAMRLVPSPIPSQVALAGVGGALLLMPGLLRGFAAGAGSEQRQRISSGVRYLRDERFPRLVFAFVFLVALLTATVDFLFRERAEQLYSESELNRLFGDLNAVVGLFALFFQVVLTPRLLRRFGLFGFLALMPLVLALVNLIAVAAGSPMPLWFALKALEMAGSFALIPAGAQLLYNPMPVEARASVRAGVDGAGRRLGAALGGVVLLALAARGDVPPLLPLYIALTILILLPMLRGGYLGALERALSGNERREVALNALDIRDSTTRRALERTLREGDRAQVEGAVATLERDVGFDFGPYLPRLLAHPASEVRVLGCKLAGRYPSAALAEILGNLLGDREAHVRSAAARALGEVDPNVAAAKLERALSDENDPALRCGAIAALWHSRVRRDLASQSIRALLARMNSLDVPLRLELTRLLGQLGNSPYAAHLERLLQDPSNAVRRTAARSIRETRDPTLLPALLQALGDRDISLHAREAIASFGDFAVPKIWAMLDDRQTPLKIRLKLPKLLRQVGTELAGEACLYSNPEEDPSLHYKLIVELYAMKVENPAVRLDKRRTDEAILRRLKAYAYYLPLVEPLAAGAPNYRLLGRAAKERVSQNLEGIIKLLSLHRSPERMHAVERGLIASEGRARSSAFELLDEALSSDPLHDAVLGTLEGLRLSSGESLTAQRAASRLSSSQDALLRSLARRCLEHVGLEAGVPLISTIATMLDRAARGPEDEDMPQPIVERILLLESVQMFESASVDDLAAVAQICSETRVPAGGMVFTEGEAGNEMYVVARGFATLEKNGRTLLTLRAGESFGQVSLLDRGRRPASVRAGEGGVELLSIARGPFMDLVTDRPELLNGLFSVLTKRLRDLLELESVPAEAREPIVTTQIAS